MTSESKQPSDLILRLTGIAYRDEAKAVTVRADDLRAVLAALSAPEPAAQGEGRCTICGEEEPYTGTCGSNDPRALCKRATRAPQSTLVAEVDWKPRVDGYEVGPTEVRWLTDPPPAGTKLYTAPPAQLMGEKMTLKEAVSQAEPHRMMRGDSGRYPDGTCWGQTSSADGFWLPMGAWQAITAHLTQPAQAVDAGAKVADAWRDAAAACLGKHSRLFRYVCEEADKLTAALRNAGVKV